MRWIKENMSHSSKNKVLCAACGFLIAVFIINSTPLCKFCFKHKYDHLPENPTTTSWPTITNYAISDSSQTTTAQPPNFF